MFIKLRSDGISHQARSGLSLAAGCHQGGGWPRDFKRDQNAIAEAGNRVGMFGDNHVLAIERKRLTRPASKPGVKGLKQLFISAAEMWNLINQGALEGS